jgi:AAHS family 4-hydroxybenzoate transporter-like MFS transporter
VALTRLDIEAFIDERPFSPFQRAVLVLCFLVTFADGFDTAAVGFVAPALSRALNVPPPDLRQLLTTGFFGLALGALVAGPLADRVGRKRVLVGSLVVFGTFSLLTARADTLGELTLMRFLTGMGLGAALPNATTLTSEYCPASRRSLLIALMFSGFTLGSAGGGFVAAALIPRLGWESVFVVGGVGPLILAIVLVARLPDSIQFLVARGGAAQDTIARIVRTIDLRADVDPHTVFVVPSKSHTHAALRVLFEDGHAPGTIALWTAFFMGLVVIYLLTSWLPTLITQSGAPIGTAAIVGALFQLGGTLGALTVSWCMDRWSPHLAVAVSYLLGAVMLIAIAFSVGNLPAVAVAVFLAGFFMSGSQSATSPLAAAFYPTLGRATGVGWMQGIGRFGAILGAFAGGALLAIGWSFSLIVGVLAAPAALAAVTILIKRQHYREGGASASG